MNPIRKSNIAALALSAAVFFSTSLLAKPPAQNYPEYPQNEGVPAAVTTAANRAQDTANQYTTAANNAANQYTTAANNAANQYTTAANNAANQYTTAANNAANQYTTQPVQNNQGSQGFQPSPGVWANNNQSSTPNTAMNAPTGASSVDVCCAGCSVGTRFDSNLVMVEKFLISAPGTVGGDVQYKVRTTARANVTNVSLTENIPSGVAIVSATPDVSTGAGNSLNWNYPTMSRGDVKEVLITVRPNQEGTFTTNTKVCVDPAVCIAFQAGTPKLAIEKVGPSTAELDGPANFDVKVTNVGSATANNVVMTDTLPQGLRGAANQTYSLGNLGAGESRTVQVPTTAVQQGHWVNRACAVADNVPQQVCAEAPIDILLAKIQVQKTGPDRRFINHEAQYNITVTNVGTTVLNNVVVTDNLPAGTKLLSVDGTPATQNQSTVTWAPIPTLQPGESKSSTLSLTSPQPGTTVNNVTATSGRLSDSASAKTDWEAPPGVLTEIVDDVDPVRVGDTVVYTIRITNQGAWRDINTQIKVMYGDEITPLECDAPGAVVNGKIVTVPDDILKPKGVKTFHIKTRAEQQGLHTTKLQFNSSFLPRPVDKDETTLVY